MEGRAAWQPTQPLDEYSRIVAGVAAELTPKVASLRVAQAAAGWREGASARPSSIPGTGSC